MAEVTESSTCVQPAVPEARGFDQTQPALTSKWYKWRRNGVAVAGYLLDAEVHTYAFSVAANAIISFIPFIVLLYTISQSFFPAVIFSLIRGPWN